MKLHKWFTEFLLGPRLYMGGGGSGGGGGQAQPQQTTVQNTNIPEYARPYVETMLGTAQQQLYNYDKDASGNMVPTSMRGYTPYSQSPSDYFAPFSPLQNQAMGAAGQLGTSPELDMASNLAGAAGQRAMNTQYQSQNFGNQFQAPRDYQAQNFGNQFQAPQQYQTGRFGAQQVNAPDLQDYQMQGPANVQGAQASAAQLGAAPEATAQQFQGPGAVGYDQAQAERVNAPQLRDLSMQAAGNVGTQSFNQPGSANQFMSPYMQNVVDVQQREAQRAADIAGTQRGAQAARSGAFGGSRAAIMDAEAARNLATQKGDIQAQGLQSAYQNAQQQFNTEQNARLQADLANQQAQQQANVQNLSAGLQTQGLGAQTGLTAQQLNQSSGLQAALANQQAGMNTGQFNANMGYNTGMQNAQLRQQAALANQGLAGQYGLQQGQFGQGANLQNAQMNQQANLANQQMGYNVGQQNLAARLGTQQFGAGQNLQAQLANQQQGMNAQQMLEQSRQFGAGQGMTAAQQRAQYGLAGQQAGEQSRQFGAGQGMTAAQQRAQYGLAGQQAGEQSRQFGANLGLQGLQSGMQAAGQLGSLGQNRYAQQTGNIGLQGQLGAQQQAQQQRYIDQQIQNYGTAQQYPQQQLAFMSGLLRGLPLQTATTQQYQAAPSSLSQVAGLGMAGYGLSRMAGMKKGGKVKAPQRKAGLAELALSKMA